MGCIPSPKDENQTIDNTVESKNIEHKNTPFVTVKPNFQKELENWSAYRNVNLFLEKYNTISPNDALNNALELQELTLTFKDNIDLDILKIPSFQARLNVLHNEVLRLSDMTFISAIKADEVNKQVEKIVTVFSSTNDKINTVFTKKKFESEITVKDIFIGLDSSKLDPETLESIKNKKLKIEVLPN